MIMRYIFCTIVFLIVISCSKKNYPHSILTVNGKSANHLIVDNYSDYGMGRSEGCEIELAFEVELFDLQENLLEGKISNRDFEDLFIGCQLILEVLNQNQISQQIIEVDDKGFFKQQYHGDIKTISISYIGYRDLVLDFTKQ